MFSEDHHVFQNACADQFPLEGIRARDRAVLEISKANNIPIATVIGGGYDDDRYALAKRHAIIIEEAFNLFAHSKVME